MEVSMPSVAEAQEAARRTEAHRQLGVRKLLETAAVAELLNLPVSTVYEHARRGLLPCVRIGRHVRFRPEAIEAFVTDGGQALEGGWRREADEAA